MGWLREGKAFLWEGLHFFRVALKSSQSCLLHMVDEAALDEAAEEGKQREGGRVRELALPFEGALWNVSFSCRWLWKF